jgi:hypothetical protein
MMRIETAIQDISLNTEISEEFSSSSLATLSMTYCQRCIAERNSYHGSVYYVL